MLQKDYREKAEAIIEKWKEEAKPYLTTDDPQPIGGARLDGPQTEALAKIQMKYLKELKELKMEYDL